MHLFDVFRSLTLCETGHSNVTLRLHPQNVVRQASYEAACTTLRLQQCGVWSSTRYTTMAATQHMELDVMCCSSTQCCTWNCVDAMLPQWQSSTGNWMHDAAAAAVRCNGAWSWTCCTPQQLLHSITKGFGKANTMVNLEQ